MDSDTRLLGRFQILNRIAQGGMGALYRAYDPMLDREVAIKVLRDDFDNDELRQRFSREAQSAARLRHPNIVTIFDVGEHGGRPFIAMEYIQGTTLAEVVKNAATTPVARKLQLMDEIASALGYAHKRGIVHRDIKPANLMVDADGTLKVLDFGIARIAESGLTQSGMMMGTLNYMSPEQLGGGVVDARSDIFAVGVVYYELLSGRQAFPGSIDKGVLTRILNGTTDALASICPTLEPAIIDIVERCLEIDPERRYQDLEATRRDIAAVRRRIEASGQPAAADTDDETVGGVPTPAPIRTPARGAASRTDLERRRREQIQNHLEEARRQLAANAYQAAMTACDQALLIDPDNATAMTLHERAREALDLHQAEEWLRDADDQMARGATAAAEQLVNRALEIAPGVAGAEAIRNRIAEVRRERDRERERQERVRNALARAADAMDRGDFESARLAAQEALERAPDSADALRLLDAAGEALRVQELRRRVRDTIESAQKLFKADQYDEALAVLDRFTPADDSIVRARTDLRRQIDAARQAQEQRRRAEAERRHIEEERRVAERNAIERARQSAERERQAAENRHLEETRHADATVVVERAPVETALSPPADSVLTTPPVASAPSRSKPLVASQIPRWAIPAGGAALVVIVLTALLLQPSPGPEPQTTTSRVIDNPTTTTAAGTTVPSTSTSVAPSTSAVTTTSVPPITSTSVPPTTTVTSAPLDARLVSLRTAGRQQLARGNLDGALASLSEGLRIDGNDAELRQILADVRRQARNNASIARRGAAAAQSTRAFAVADRSFSEADALARARKDDEAARMFLTAANQFAQAAKEPRPTDSIASLSSQPPPPVTSAPPTSAPSSVPITRTTTSALPTTTVTTSAAPPPATTTTAQPDPRALAIGAINRVLDECEAAWGSMNPSTMAVCGPTLANSARQRLSRGLLQSQSLRIGNRRVTELSEDSATVACQLTFQDVSKRDGVLPATSSQGTIALRKRNQSWMIEAYQIAR